MDLSREFVVAVRSEEESRRVQEKFFEMGIRWAYQDKASFANEPTESYGHLAAIRFDRTFRHLNYAGVHYYRDDGLTILTADEFLLRGRQAMFIQPRR